jgi:hypothetical protein
MLYTSVHHIIQVVLESSLDAKKKQILLIITKSKKLLGFIKLYLNADKCPQQAVVEKYRSTK